jgi:DNA-binding NtrC family response regulator
MADILVVDDNREVAEPLMLYLQFQGHVVRYAENGVRGLEEIDQRFPDLIFLDIEMPKLTGPEMAYGLLVKDAGREEIPIIVLSAVADIEEIVREIGTPYFIEKPYELNAVEKLVEKVLKERRAPNRKKQRNAA